MQVLYSEYGQGVPEHGHAAQMLRLVDRLGIDRRTVLDPVSRPIES